MNEIYMVYAQGFVFLGRLLQPVIGMASSSSLLKMCIRVDTVNTISPQGINPNTVLRPLGADLTIDLNKYPHHIIGKSHALYREYIKAETGIELP